MAACRIAQWPCCEKTSGQVKNLTLVESSKTLSRPTDSFLGLKKWALFPFQISLYIFVYLCCKLGKTLCLLRSLPGQDGTLRACALQCGGTKARPCRAGAIFCWTFDPPNFGKEMFDGYFGPTNFRKKVTYDFF